MRNAISAASVALLLATGAHAATFSGQFSGTWASAGGPLPPATGGTNSCLSGTERTLYWGDEDDCPDNSGNSQDSSLSTAGSDKEGFRNSDGFSEEITGHETVKVGTIRWENRPNPASTTVNIFANLNMVLDIDGFGQVTELLQFQIDNTANPEGDDILALWFDDFGGVPIDLGNGLTLDGFSFELQDPVDGETLTTGVGTGANEGRTLLNWDNPEGHPVNFSWLTINAEISPAAVPLPAAGWMLIAGVGGLVAMRRRRKS